MHPNGLKPLPRDPRDYPLGAISSIPKLEDIKPLGVKPVTILNQIADGNDDFCSAYALCGALEPFEGQLSPEFQFAASKDISGDPLGWGQNLRDAMSSATSIGISERSKTTIPLNPTDRRYFKNYSDENKKQAQLHRQQTYFKTSGNYEPVDNVRAWIYKLKRPVVLGVVWGWDLSDYELNGVPTQGFGHAIYAIDFTQDGRLVVVNSAGMGAGKNGTHLLSREAANEFIGQYGAYMTLDYSPEAAQALVNVYRKNKPWYWKLWQKIRYN